MISRRGFLLPLGTTSVSLIESSLILFHLRTDPITDINNELFTHAIRLAMKSVVGTSVNLNIDQK